MASYQYNNAGVGRMTNPALKKIKSAIANESVSTSATYAGVTIKTVYFLLLTVVGAALYFVLENQLLNLTPETYTVVESEGVFEFAMTAASGGVIVGVSILTVVMALISIFVTAAVPITGSIYSIAEGYLLAFIVGALSSEYEWMGLMALMLTIIIVFTLLALYASGKVYVSRRFRAVVSTVFITIVVMGLLMFLFHFIPGLNVFSNMWGMVMANPVVGLVLSIFFIVVACMFLISDFEAVRSLVDNRLPKKYEWGCAFGIAYTVLYLYIKILELLIRIFGKKSNN